MAKLAELRKKAKELGIAPSVVRGATSAKELREIIEEHNGNGSKKKSTAKKAVKKAVTKTTGKKRGRPKGSKNSTSKSAPATKSAKSGKAKRQTAASGGNGGRNMLGKINYNDTDGWNPREGSAPDRIVKALKKFKGDREKVFQFLKKDVWDFASKRLSDGSKRHLTEGRYSAHNMLRYRIARTDWDFAVKTGQHDPSEDRVEYGTGGTGEGIFNRNGKKSKAKATASKNSKTTKTTGKKRGRPAGSKNKTTTKATATTGKKRGRPKGSKNKNKKK